MKKTIFCFKIKITKLNCVTMTCNIKTRNGSPCSRRIVYTVESFEDGVVRRLYCCAQHKLKAIREVFDKATHFQHGQRTRSADAYINTIVTVSRCDLICDNIETHYFGTVTFEPISERTHLKALYNEYFDERSRIGMFGLHLEDIEWRARYDDCVHKLRMIDHRLESIN